MDKKFVYFPESNKVIDLDRIIAMYPSGQDKIYVDVVYGDQMKEVLSLDITPNDYNQFIEHINELH